MAGDLGGPVAVKLLSERLGHKSDIGGVRPGLTGPGAVETATADLIAIARGVGVPGAKLLVQRMVPGDVELIAGIRRDPAFGPLVVTGFGGVLADVLGDSQAAAAPVDHAAARRMLKFLVSGERPGG